MVTSSAKIPVWDAPFQKGTRKSSYAEIWPDGVGCLFGRKCANVSNFNTPFISMSLNKSNSFNTRICDAYKGECKLDTCVWCLSATYFVMSSQSSSSPQESTDSEATWKRKYLVLKAEHRNAFGTGRVKRSGFFPSTNYKPPLTLQCICSLAETQVSLGRCLKRAVDMFRAPRELVEESDWQTELFLSGSTEDSSAE